MEGESVQDLGIFLITLPIYLYISAIYALFFRKAGERWWAAFVPIYSSVVWLRMIKKPDWWSLMLLVPIVNLFYGVGMVVEMLHAFGKHKFQHRAMGIAFGIFYLPYVALSKDSVYTHPDKQKRPRKSNATEWADAIIFAVFAATFIRLFVIEAYTIPTSSMEKSLLIGDFLFVSKVSYGPRTPNTPLAFPFAHHTIPILDTKAYLEWVKLPYYRIPGLGKIKNNDVVVFNYPMEGFRPVDK